MAGKIPLGRIGAISVAFLLVGTRCGFGTYDDGASPQETSSNNGVADAGQWWPWVCPDGNNPAPATTPLSYTVSGTCGDGGTFVLSVDGCEMEGNWAILGLSDVSTTLSSSIPAAGGWQVTGDGGLNSSDGGSSWTCTAAASTQDVLTFTCTGGAPTVDECVSTLTPVSTP